MVRNVRIASPSSPLKFCPRPSYGWDLEQIRPGDTRHSHLVSEMGLFGGKMRVRLWSSVLPLVVIACLMFPAVLFAADASAATAVDPNSAAASAAPTNNGASAGAGPGFVISPTLVDLLVKKGILTTTEANSLRNVSGSAAMEQLLLLLKAKGVVNDTEAAELKNATAEAESMHSLVDTESGPLTSASLITGQAAQAKPAEPTGPVVIPAIAPVRVLPLDPPVKDSLLPALKLGGGARLRSEEHT